MEKGKFQFNRILTCILVLLSVKGLYAAKIPFSNFVSGAAVLVTTPTPVSYSEQEDEFNNLPNTNGFSNAAILNKVWVGVDHSSLVYVNTAYSYRFKLRVESWNNNTVNPQTSNDIYLNVSYDPLASNDYKDKSIYSFTNGHKVKVSILEIYDYGTSSNITNPPDNIRVQTEIEVERYYTFNTASINCPSHTLSDLNGDAVADQMTINWSPITGAEEYDLEWTYVDDYDVVLGTPKSISNIEWNFMGDNTRINTRNTFYKINLTYDRGYVIYRIRGVGRVSGNNQTYLYGVWSKPESGTNPSSGSCPGSYYNVQSHLASMNWQYTSSFAEEGKKKEVIAYYDGSLRNRQTVTVNNTDNNAIAGESYYDYQGRKALDALPVPTGNSALGYNPNFNVNVSLDRYSKLDFDQDGINGCSSGIGPMSNSSGSAKYYSSSNPQNSGNNAFIPDADQYPFSQVEYTPDNTGRIRRMGGVGPNHQLNTGKETKYYYGQPTQWELDRLFGSEVGYNSHYKKNMVVDPNGQISISYIDMHGRVIATALSGESPESVMALNNDDALTVEVDLLAKDPNGYSLNNVANSYFSAIIFNTQLLVSSPGNHNFEYSLEMPQLTDSCLTSNICFDCIYDLNITITDECGTVVYQTNLTKVGSPLLNSTCSSNIIFTNSPSPLTLNLGIGNYHISKTLTINEEAYNYYLSLYLSPENNTCFKSYEEILEEEMALINYDDCNYSCQRCVQLLGSRDEYVLSGRGTEEDWVEAYKICTEPCTPSSPCDLIYKAMLTDMTPGGQYAEWFDSTLNAVQVKSFPLSILNDENVLPDGGVSSSTGAFWRNPKLQDGTAGYFEADLVSRSRIYVEQQTDLTYLPKIKSGVTPLTDVQGQYVYPEQLLNLEDFISAWKASWANSLVKYHPEFCYFQWCTSNLEGQTEEGELKSYEFDDLLENTQTYSDAVSNGLITGSDFDLVDQDPYFSYFNMQNGVDQKALMNTKCTAYKVHNSIAFTMKQIAAMAAKCGSFYGDNFAASCTTFATGTTAQLNSMWTAYKAFYIGYKQELIKAAADDHTLNSNCKGFNACIGTTGFNPFATKANSTNFNTFWINLNQPCAASTFALYQTKTKRFLIGDIAALNVNSDQAAYSYFVNTGKCPGEKAMIELLSEIMFKSELTTTTDLHTYYAYTPALYTTITGASPGGTYVEYETVSTITGANSEKLDLDFRLKGTSTIFNCGLKFQMISNPNGYAWSQVCGMGKVSQVGTDPVSGRLLYDAVLLIDDNINSAPQEFTVRMSACSDINTCLFYDQCLITDYGYQLQILMSALAKGGSLNSQTAVNLETLYPDFLNRHIRNEIGGVQYTNLRWIYNNNNTFTLSDPVTTPAGNSITITFNTPSFTSYNLIRYFENIRLKSGDVQHGFLIDAWYEPSPGAALVKVSYDVTVSHGDINKCYDPVPLQCDQPEFRAKRDLEALLSDILIPNPSLNIVLNSNKLYTSLLESYIGNGYTYLSKPDYTNDMLSAYIMVYADDQPGAQLLNQCKLELFRLNDAYEKINDFSQIASLANLKANELKYTDGKIFYFTIEATFPNDVTEIIGGYTSCIPLANCGCDDASVSVCLNTYKATIDAIAKYNANYNNANPQNFEIDALPDYENYSCECGESYLKYLQDFTSTEVAPMSFDEYVKSNCMPEGIFCPEFENYLRGLEAYNDEHPTATIEPDYNMTEGTCACIASYVQYLLTFNMSSQLFTGPPMSLSDYLAQGCDFPFSDDDCITLLSTYTTAVNAKITEYNNTVLPPNSTSLPGAPLPPATPTSADCRCVVKYIALLENYIMNGMASSGIMAGFPAPPDFATFVAQGCQGPCISEYFIYAETMANAGITPETFDQNKCECYLYYTNYFNSMTIGGVFMGLSFNDFCDDMTSGQMAMMGGNGSQGGGSVLKGGEVSESETSEKDKLKKETEKDTVYTEPVEMLRDAQLSFEEYSYTPKQRTACVPQDTMIYPEVTIINACFDYLDGIAELNARLRYQMQVEYFTERFRNRYMQKCLTPVENLTLEMPNHDYHYTLYYYDQAGNLTRTVPPAGVQLITSSSDLSQIISDRYNNEREIFTDHGLQTTYEYNSLNQLIRQSIPDNMLMNRWMVYNHSPGIPGGTEITDLRFIDANVGYLIGNGALGAELYRTTDGGKTFARVNIETSDLSKVKMLDANNGFACGAGGLFFVTTDGAVNWKLIQVRSGSTPVNVVFNDLHFKDASNGILIGNNGACYRAELVSGNWSFYSSSGFSGVDFIACDFSDASTGYISAINAGLSVLYKISSWPGGSSGFTLSSLNFSTHLKSLDFNKVCMIDASNGFAAGVEGQLLKTTDGGNHWIHLASAVVLNFKDIYFIDASKGIALAGDGKFYSTDNGGNIWKAISSLGFYNAMHMYDKSGASKYGFAVGEDGLLAQIIYQTSKGFRVFKKPLFSNSLQDMKSVFALSHTAVYAAGNNGQFWSLNLVVDDWKSFSINTTGTVLDGENIVKMYFNSSSLGAFVTSDGQFIKGVYSNPNWSFSDQTGSYTFRDIDYNGTDVYALSVPVSGSSASVIKTGNTSLSTFSSVYSITMNVSQELNNLHIINGGSSVISAGVQGALFLNSADKSKNTQALTIKSIKAIPSGNTVFASGSDGTFIRSDDAGVNWNSVASGTHYNINSIDAASSTEVYLAGNSGTLLKYNGTVVTALSSGITNNLHSVKHYNSTWVAAGGEQRTLLLSDNSGSSFNLISMPGEISVNSSIKALHANGSNLFFSAASGMIYKFNGSVFSRSMNVTEPANQIRFNAKAKSGIIACNSATVITSSNNGNNWVLKPMIGTDVSTNINTAWIFANDNILLAGNNNWCRLWNPLNNNLSTPGGLSSSGTVFKDVSFNKQGKGFLIDNSNGVYYSYNSGSGFTLSTISGAVLNSVALEYNDAYIAANGNKVYHYNSLPAGALGSPTTYTTSTASSDFKKVVLIDRKSGYITGTNGQVLKMTTASGALQFAAQFSNTGSSNTALSLNAVHFNTRGSVVIGGASGYIRSADDDAQTISNLFWYDELGRLVVSQNTKQFNYSTKAYSYTLFDSLGRITEVGETVNATGPESNLDGHNLLYSGIVSWVAGGSRRQVSATYYDDAFAPGGAGITQINLRKRVASISYEEVFDGNPATYDHASHYSYDIHGNVDVMVQEVTALSAVGNSFKKMRYEYDLISGKVNSVHFNETKADQYHHRYTYDADNRITHVESSRDKVQWDNDARYFYYPHGPLMRAEIGDLKVQGVDFAYTLHGWIKGVNAGMLDPNRDMGADAKVAGGNTNQYVGRDAFGYILGYFAGDYESINSSGSNHFEPATSGSDLMNFRENLYNGNITTMQTALPNCSTYNAGRSISSETFGNAYNYDQLNRIMSSRTFTNLITGSNAWASSGSPPSQNYSTDYTYDANGNITGLTRWGNGSAMDEFSYNYDVQGGRLVSNKLYHVNDNTALSGNYPDDIDDQGSFTSTPATINTANNYGYDELGNLIRDDAEEIANIEWNVQGKISRITRSSGSSKSELEFTYDAMGQRLSKKVTPQSGIVKTFYYIRDAMGNEMCRYVSYTENSVDYFVSEEHSLYGSSRLGVDTRRDTLYMGSVQSVSYDYVYRHLGKKQYELSNHLGNVLATVTDQVKPNSSGGVTIDNYDPVIVSISDYYPFGSVISDRSWSDQNRQYRFGFNGMVIDEDFYSTEFRLFNSRLGKWTTLDPIRRAYESSYSSFSNNPIVMVDPDGNSDYYTADGEYLGSDGTENTEIYIVTDEEVIQNIKAKRVADKLDPSYLLYSEALAEGTYFILPPYEDRQKIKKQMDEHTLNQEIGGKGWISTDGLGNTYYAEAQPPTKSATIEELILFEKELDESIKNGTPLPTIPYQVNVHVPKEKAALNTWRKAQTGSKPSYTWHSHPFNILYAWESNGVLTYSLNEEPKDGYETMTVYNGDLDGTPNSNPSPVDIEHKKGESYPSYIISKAAGTVTRFTQNGNTTTMSANNFYNLQAKKKPN